jgi:predicted nucleic acid-binding protein
MKALFDTSALVPVFYGDHVHHKASLDLFIQFDKSEGCCGVYTLAEVYSTLTRMPGKHRISGEQAMLFIGSIRERLSIVALNNDEYADALEAAAALGIVGGGIYDAILAHCAIKANAQTIYSWNIRHYAQCGPEVIRRLRTPQQFVPSGLLNTAEAKTSAVRDPNSR